MAKLQELGVPKNACNNVTCDYIMVIATSKKKTKTHIAGELAFVLGEKSEEFVEWYLAICKRLKSIDKKTGLLFTVFFLLVLLKL